MHTTWMTRRSAIALAMGAIVLAGCGNGSMAQAGTAVRMPAITPRAPTATAAEVPAPATQAPGTAPAATTAPATTMQAPVPATTAPELTTEPAVAPEQNPAGDIPDTQAFVSYHSADGGFLLETPEGWARSSRRGGVNFVDKLDGLSVDVTTASAAPTVASVRGVQVAELEQHGRAVQVSSVKQARLPAGSAVLVVYTSNSDPDPVTGKQVRLENNTYFIPNKGGKLAALRLWAPVGADNVDQWQRIAQSFKWAQ